jgi:hypothetical protein
LERGKLYRARGGGAEDDGQSWVEGSMYVDEDETIDEDEDVENDVR